MAINDSFLYYAKVMHKRIDKIDEKKTEIGPKENRVQKEGT